MKKKITLAGFSVLFLMAILFTAATTQQGKDKNNNAQKEAKGKNNGQAAKAKNDAPQNKQPGNQAKNDNKPDKAKNDKAENGNKNGNTQDKDSRDKGKNENGNGNDGRGKINMKDGYVWDRETFKDRRKYKNQDKVSVCHKFNGNNNEPAVTINVSANALKAHMNHGDAMGACPTLTDRRWSDIFIRNRNDYYNNVQTHYEQVSYSRSILDYAISRLTNSRQQLVTMQNSGVPVSQIETKQATVVQLEQNVSLLETLIGVATTIVAEKLQ